MEKISKTRLIAIVMVVAMTLPLSCQKGEEPGQKSEADLEMSFKNTSDFMTPLIAGQTNNIGEININYLPPSDIALSYVITEPAWCLLETHLDVQVDPANFPQTKSGNPKVGLFAFREVLSCEPSWGITIDLSSIDGWAEGMTIYIASHAEVFNGAEAESAWGEGLSFPGNNWAMFFEYEPPSWECGDPLIDERDGKEYGTVQIGGQCWMAQNLNIGTRINGSGEQTDNELIEKYCFNNDESNCNLYGGLYEWDEMMQYMTQEGARGICPEGWHVPSDAEWTALTDHIRGQPEYCCNANTFNIGKALASTTLWYGPSGYPCGIGNDPGTNNTTGFSGLPGGSRTFTTQNPPQPRFYYLSTFGYWWTSTASDDLRALGRSLYWDRAGIGTSNVVKGTGYSIRCLRDE